MNNLNNKQIEINHLLRSKGWTYIHSKIYCKQSTGTIETWCVISTKGDGTFQTHKAHFPKTGIHLESGTYDMNFAEALANFKKRSDNNNKLFADFEDKEQLHKEYDTMINSIPKETGIRSVVTIFIARLQSTLSLNLE